MRRPCRTGLVHTLRNSLVIALSLIVGISLASALLPPSNAWAVPTTGEHFTSTWTEITGADPGLTGTADIILGAADGPGFHHVSSFSVTIGTSICFSCGLLTEDLSAVLFDDATLLLKGDITGSFLGGGGGLHTFDLAVTDPSSGPGAWTFTNVKVSDGSTDVSTGTYDPAVLVVPEPASLVLLGVGLAGLAGVAWRRRYRQ